MMKNRLSLLIMTIVAASLSVLFSMTASATLIDQPIRIDSNNGGGGDCVPYGLVGGGPGCVLEDADEDGIIIVATANQLGLIFNTLDDMTFSWNSPDLDPLEIVFSEFDWGAGETLDDLDEITFEEVYFGILDGDELEIAIEAEDNEISVVLSDFSLVECAMRSCGGVIFTFVHEPTTPPPPTTTTVPEPTTLALLGIGLAGVGTRFRRKT